MHMSLQPLHFIVIPRGIKTFIILEFILGRRNLATIAEMLIIIH